MEIKVKKPIERLEREITAWIFKTTNTERSLSAYLLAVSGVISAMKNVLFKQ